MAPSPPSPAPGGPARPTGAGRRGQDVARPIGRSAAAPGGDVVESDLGHSRCVTPARARGEGDGRSDGRRTIGNPARPDGHRDPNELGWGPAAVPPPPTSPIEPEQLPPRLSPRSPSRCSRPCRPSCPGSAGPRRSTPPPSRARRVRDAPADWPAGSPCRPPTARGLDLCTRARSTASLRLPPVRLLRRHRLGLRQVRPPRGVIHRLAGGAAGRPLPLAPRVRLALRQDRVRRNGPAGVAPWPWAP